MFIFVKNLLYLQIITVNSILIKILKLFGHFFKLKTMLNTTAAMFIIAVVCVVKSTSVNL